MSLIGGISYITLENFRTTQGISEEIISAVTLDMKELLGISTVATPVHYGGMYESEINEQKQKIKKVRNIHTSQQGTLYWSHLSCFMH